MQAVDQRVRQALEAFKARPEYEVLMTQFAHEEARLVQTFSKINPVEHGNLAALAGRLAQLQAVKLFFSKG